jgi:hypothetical protein
MKKLTVTLILSYVVLAVLGVGAVWDMGFSMLWGWPSFCEHLRWWNTASNDLLASCMAGTIGFLFCRWAWGPQTRWATEFGFEWGRDSRILFCCFAFAALFCHLFLLYWLHLAHIELVR